ncbi:MAG: hypothetical protein VKP62_06415 [Candidatus Sericytochromatia bacterium]|nr:hypothetical protein [Candidatus Sericytochromatia bacterium]
MAHYAILNEHNIVTQVFVGKDEHELGPDGQPWDWEAYYGAKRTSYNTQGGQHLTGGTPYRKNYAGIGFSYDETRDAFIPPQPYPSWTLDEATCLWQPPTPMPTDGKLYAWSEPDQLWLEVTP